MNEIFYIKVITLSFLGLSVVGLMCWIFRPKSKKLYESLSKIPLNEEEKNE
ncbi:MAG: cbb3-type cytochrome c oxidase subunit 3 [Candidatus Midichloriaceae bacterium]